MYHGDIRLEDTIDIKFTTVSTTGAPTTLAGTPVVSAYPANSLTQLTAGITLTVDFDGVTGLHNIRVVATAANGYLTATDYALVITTGTVGGTSVVGYVVGSFSIEKRSALMPTTVARTLDVSAGGEAGLDWANIGSPTTAQNLSATNIDVDQVVASVSGAVGSVTGAVGSVTGAVGSVAAGGITAASIATGAVDADALAADAVVEIAGGVWDEDATGHQTQGTFGQAIGDPVADANTIYKAVVTDAAGATVGVDVVAVQADTDNIQTRLPAALVGGRMDSDVGNMQAGTVTAAVIATGAIDADAIADNAIDAGAIAADAITAAKIANGAIDAATFAAGAIDAAALAADAVGEIADGVWDEDATGHQTLGTYGQAIGDPVADATTIYQAVVTDAAGASIAADIAAIEAQTDDIGVAGAGLTNLPWNATWDAEVQSEVDDALVAQRLDELLNADSDIDGAAPPTDGSVVHELLTKVAAGFTYDQTTDSLEAIRDAGTSGSFNTKGFTV